MLLCLCTDHRDQQTEPNQDKPCFLGKLRTIGLTSLDFRLTKKLTNKKAEPQTNLTTHRVTDRKAQPQTARPLMHTHYGLCRYV